MNQIKNKYSNPLPVRFPDELENEIRAKAATRGVSLSQVIVEAVRHGLPIYDKEVPARFVAIDQPEAVAA